MKDKIFQLLKQAYKSLGLGDEVLQAHAEMLANTGIVTEDNVQTIVEGQKNYLTMLQKENDRRVTDAQKKLQQEQAKAEEEAKAKAAEEAKRKAEEEAKKAEEEAERKRLEEIKRQNEVPESLKKYIEEMNEKSKARDEEFKTLIATLTDGTKKRNDEYNKQIEEMTKSSKEQSEVIKSLQETIRKQQEEAKAKEEADAKAKAKAEHDAKILSKAKELGIPQSRIEEGFVIADDATDETITNYLTKVSNNYKTSQQPVFGGYQKNDGTEPSKEDVENIATKLVNNL